MVMGIAPATAAGMGAWPVQTAATGADDITGDLATAWFIILLFTTSMGLVTAVPSSPATKLAL